MGIKEFCDGCSRELKDGDNVCGSGLSFVFGKLNYGITIGRVGASGPAFMCLDCLSKVIPKAVEKRKKKLKRDEI